MNKTAICSIASKNYYSHAKALFASVREFHRDVDLHFLLADEIEGKFDKEAEFFEIIEAKDLGIKEFRAMSFMYDIIELNVALKPFLIQYLLTKGYEKIIYFDVDIMVFNKLDLIMDLLDTYSIVITPHITKPILDEEGFNIKEQGFLKNGAYNAGFIAVSKTETTVAFLDWWSKKCKTVCFREPETGLFVDQKWLDLLPGLFDYVCVLRHLGCNMAYWNFHERVVEEKLVNGNIPLIFFHFSGLEVDNLNQISKYQNRYTLDNRQDLVDIFELYRNNLHVNGYTESKVWIYKYGSYENGKRIGILARRLYNSTSKNYNDPFSCEKGSYYYLLKSKRLLETDSQGKVSMNGNELRIKLFNIILKIIERILGAGRYNAFMIYIRYISVIRRQDFLIK